MNEALMPVLAQTKLAEVETLVALLAAAEGNLEKGYAKLAYLLDDVAQHRYWDGSYKSMGEFMDHISGTFKISKAQLYNYRAAAHDLGDSVTEEQLNAMGISKALALREAKNNTGSIPQSVMDAALDTTVTVKDIRKLLFDAGTITKPEDGTWMDLDFSCYVSEEEKAEISDAMRAARETDPPISQALKEFQQRKEVLLRFAREFLGAWAGGEDVV